MQTLFQEPENDDAAVPVSVLASAPVDRTYSYAATETLEPGTYVSVPLGKRETTGIVWDEIVETGKTLKTIIVKHDLPPMPEVHRKFIDWVARYTMTRRGAVLKMALPVAIGPEKTATGYRLTEDAETGMVSPAKQKILVYLKENSPRRLSEITKETGATPATIKDMAKAGLLHETVIHAPFPCSRPDPSHGRVDLSPAQQEAATRLRSMEKFGVALLDGVTGAGKTETYFEAVAAALERGKQVLILMPEIALTNAFTDRFTTRFGCLPALWHSSVSPAKRRTTWRGIVEGRTKVVVGARSALFLPFANLGLIVVDEEHDPAYKQEDGAIYNARDMAVTRAHLGDFPVMLVSATPSLETMANVWNGRYAHIRLPDRYGGAKLPDVTLIDMKKDKPERGRFIAPALRQALTDNLTAGGQSLLFLNRRGYAPLTICRTCGHRIECPRCSAWLVEHRRTNRLNCHHCGHTMNTPTQCPSCHDKDSLTACGPGVERIFEEVKEAFPEARSLVLASDTTEDPEELRRLLTGIRDHEYDIVIGTQIIAKGHHFPDLTLVGVIDADLGLRGGELRAAERTFQLLHQVAGRAGREDKPGRVFIQTWTPDNKLMRALAANDRDRFMELEAREREAAGMPPYSRLAGIIVSGKNERQVEEHAAALGRSAPQGEGIGTLGPAEAPIYRLRGNYRRRLLVRADRKINLQKAIAEWLMQAKAPSTVRVQTDIDPQGFL